MVDSCRHASPFIMVDLGTWYVLNSQFLNTSTAGTVYTSKGRINYYFMQTWINLKEKLMTLGDNFPWISQSFCMAWAFRVQGWPWEHALEARGSTCLKTEISRDFQVSDVSFPSSRGTGLHSRMVIISLPHFPRRRWFTLSSKSLFLLAGEWQPCAGDNANHPKEVPSLIL